MKKGKNVGSTETKLHLENIIKCLICQIGWANDQDVPEIQANNQMEFTCPNCDKKFDKNTDLEEHECALVSENPFTWSKHVKKIDKNSDL